MDENELNIVELLEDVWQKKVIVLIAMIICTTAFLIYNAFFVEPRYCAVSKLILTNVIEKTDGTATEGETSSDAITQNDFSFNEVLISSYKEILTSNSVLEKVKENCELSIDIGKLKSDISLAINANIMSITVESDSTDEAKKIADEIAKVFSERITELYKIENMQILDSATGSSSPINKDFRKFALIGLLAGFAGSISIIVLLNICNPKIRDAELVEDMIGTSVLASISKYNKSKFLSTTIDNKGSITDEFNKLRTIVEYGLNRKVKTVLVTSSDVGEGKSWVTFNFAVALAKIGKKVLIIDTDNRRGRLHEIFDLEKNNGFSDYLCSSDSNIRSYIKPTNIENVDIITTGKDLMNFSELLMSKKTENLLSTTRGWYDYVIVDTIPNLVLTDGIVLSRLVDTCLCVVKYNSTKVKMLKFLKRNIEKVGGNVAGVVINQTPNKKHKDLYSYERKDYNKRKLLETNFK